ncbi:MAG: hypothetical protein V1787_00400 [Candidatus Micrarchaeota archaeon]
MARARTALAQPDSEAIRLCRALLSSDAGRLQLYTTVYSYSYSGRLSSYHLALEVSGACRVSEPTARRAIRRMRTLGLLEGGGRDSKFMPVVPTRLARALFDG